MKLAIGSDFKQLNEKSYIGEIVVLSSKNNYRKVASFTYYTTSKLAKCVCRVFVYSENDNTTPLDVLCTIGECPRWEYKEHNQATIDSLDKMDFDTVAKITTMDNIRAIFDRLGEECIYVQTGYIDIKND